MTTNNNNDENNLNAPQESEEDLSQLQDRDIKELSDAFEDYMDNIIDEEKKSEIN